MDKRLLGKDDLAQFEVAQLANLCCEDAEEAKALIPRYIYALFMIQKSTHIRTTLVLRIKLTMTRYKSS